MRTSFALVATLIIDAKTARCGACSSSRFLFRHCLCAYRYSLWLVVARIANYSHYPILRKKHPAAIPALIAFHGLFWQVRGGVPLIYHVRFDGTEDPNVPEADVSCGAYYEAVVRELERCRDLTPPADAASAMRTRDPSHPLETGTPVRCRWMDVHVPEMHGRWLPGTVNSCMRIGGDAAARYSYRILFDSEHEIRDVDQSRVLGRAAHDELYRERSRAGGGWASWSAEEVYKSFLRKEPLRHQPWGEERGAAGQHDTDRRCDGRQEQGRTAGQLDLLFTASQIATPGKDATNMREATAMDDCYDVYNRTRVEGEQQMMALV